MEVSRFITTRSALSYWDYFYSGACPGGKPHSLSCALSPIEAKAAGVPFLIISYA
jgi:hypothetical protein